MYSAISRGLVCYQFEVTLQQQSMKLKKALEAGFDYVIEKTA
jgi:hypothetical protein